MSAKGFVRGAVLAVALALAAPAAASATNYYVDQDAGDDSNTCLGAGLQACEHIQAAVTRASLGDTVHVADPTVQMIFTEHITDNQGVSIVSDSSDPTENVINGAAAGPAISIAGSTLANPARVEGFTIRGRNFTSLSVGSPSIIKGNRFNDAGPILGGQSAHLALESTSNGTLVTQNTFIDPDASDLHTQTGVSFSASGATEVSDNTFDSLTQGVVSQGGAGSTPLIARNAFTHIRPGGNGLGTAIAVNSGNPTITRNQISTPSPAMAGNSLFGVLANLNGANTTGATLRANGIDGMTTGAYFGNTGGSVTLEGDVIVNSAQIGLRLVDDNTDDVAVGDATATNVDILSAPGNFGEVLPGQALVTLNSSIIGDTGIDETAGGTCTISYSRGPTTSGSVCQTFQTSASPQFANAAAGNYHLAVGSPMINAGDPATPDANAIDMDGEAFGFLPTTCPVTVGNRDIGADEVVPTGCPPPAQTDPVDQTPPDETPPQGDPPDKTAPETTLTQAPKGKLRHRKATFAFVATEAGSTFRCSLDGAAPSPCTSPMKLKRLKLGKHRFEVAAVDTAGNVDQTPALAKFKVRPARRR